MDPARSVELLGLLVCLVIVSIASAAEAALSTISRHRINTMLDSGERRANVVMHLLEDPYHVRIGTLLLGTSATITATALLLTFVYTWSGWEQAGALFVFGLIWLTIGTTLPKTLATTYPDTIALRVAAPLRILLFLVAPLQWLLRVAAKPIGLVTGQHPQLVTEEELKLLVNVGEEEGVIEAEEREMIQGIFEFGDTVVREVMVPRIDVIAVEAHTSVDAALELIIKVGHSRMPVYEGSIDHISGVLYAKDLLPLLRDGRRSMPLHSIVRPAYFVPETMKVDDLMRALQSRKVHMAIIVDEYGGTAGLVTIEDLLEEIVGEIQDEYDVEEAPIEQVGIGQWLFDGRISLDEVNDLTDLNLANEDVDSLGGFVSAMLGTIPIVGDKIEVANAKIEVATVRGLRPHRLRLTLPQTDPEPAVTTGELANDQG
jgi:CBS domain containing-hemolysin-like protein